MARSNVAKLVVETLELEQAKGFTHLHDARRPKRPWR
jgi:hypothetical protein